MKVTASLLVIAATLFGLSQADVYMQTRGSNNRLKGTGRERDNANRLFDSQNNARGGYNVGSHYFYQGSVLPVEWTNQHSCGNANNKCEMILQYTCDDRLRDGTIEKTIPEDLASDLDPRYGRQESAEYYRNCKYRSRNKGIFVADQNLKHTTAISTRQNPGATRYGYECTEERDHYPYWGPTPWRDVAILTNDPQRCEAYKKESQNVKSRFYCHVPEEYYQIANINNAAQNIPITEQECAAFKLEKTVNGELISVGGTWTEVPSFGIAPPVCRQNIWTRDNHLGNAVGGQAATFNWTIPYDISHERCAYRLRYNITTGDFDGFESLTSVQSSDVDAKFNGKNKVNIAKNWEDRMTAPMDDTTAKDRGYTLQGNPDVDIFGSLVAMPKLQLNINTAQFFRTFEDRSHRFAIRKRDGVVPEDAVIHNVNVRGKRGNIVQVFPAVEYDFSPNKLSISLGDYVHFQWTGSKRNPANNDGQGAAGTDASNIVGIIHKPFVTTSRDSERLPTEGALGANIPKKLSPNKLNFLGFNNKTLVDLATNGVTQFGGDMDQLNDAGTYFDLGPKQIGSLGIFNYLCTRNNNFSNRSQKGTVLVDRARSNSTVVGWGSDRITAGTTHVDVAEGAFKSAQEVGISSGPAFIYDLDDKDLDIKSDVVILSTTSSETGDLSGPVKITIAHYASPIGATQIYYSEKMDGEWVALETEVGDSDASVYATKAGAYMVRSPVSGWVIALISIGVVALVVLAIGLIIYCRKVAVTSAYKRAGVDIN